MDEFERDKISKGFADLTALLENAATLAVDGQSGKRSLISVRAIVEDIWPLMVASVAALGSIERYVDDDQNKLKR